MCAAGGSVPSGGGQSVCQGSGVWVVRWRVVSGSWRRHSAAVAMAFPLLLLLWCRSPGCWPAAAGGGAPSVAARGLLSSRRPRWAPRFLRLRSPLLVPTARSVLWLVASA